MQPKMKKKSKFITLRTIAIAGFLSNKLPCIVKGVCSLNYIAVYDTQQKHDAKLSNIDFYNTPIIHTWAMLHHLIKLLNSVWADR